jgi:lipopolysaccharide export system protein LptA
MTPGAGNPIDIQADEQEFASDHVVARGKVRVVYGDTTIRAPIATLFRDEAGQPKLAVFTGNPTLSQGVNLVRANKLTFNIKEAIIIAEGNAHSEVLSSSMGAGQSQAANNPSQNAKKTASKKAPVEEEAVDGDPPEAVDEMPDDAASQAPESGAAPLPPKKPAESKPQKIITDSDRQEFERNSGKFEAHGNVRVTTQGINVKANHLRLVYGTDNKPEAVVFTGNVTARRDSNVTQSDVMTYFLSTQRLQATGRVRSRVVQENAAGPKKGGLSSAVPKAESTTIAFDPVDDGSELIIISDAQDYNKETGRVDAEGRVKLYFGSTTGTGPKIALTSNEYGQAEKVVFIGRSQICQPGKRWIADRITFTVEDRKVLAEGNTRAIIVKQPTTVSPVRPPRIDVGQNERLAGENKLQ